MNYTDKELPTKTITLTTKESQRFAKTLLNPKKPNNALLKAAKQYSRNGPRC